MKFQVRRINKNGNHGMWKECVSENNLTMIQANELRIGNWVMFGKDEFPSQVTGKSFAVLEIYPDRLGWIAPIPLTPEILEKAGFVEGYVDDYVIA